MPASSLVSLFFVELRSVFPFHVCILQPEVQQSFPINSKFCRVDLLLLRRHSKMNDAAYACRRHAAYENQIDLDL